MSFSIKKIFSKKVVVTLFVFSLLFAYPQQTKAQYVDVANSAKEYVGDPIAFIVANAFIKKFSAQTVAWINSGFKGNPGYLTDPGQFFLDIADNEAGRFLSTDGLKNLCSPWKAQVRLALVKNYLSDEQNNTCTLGKLEQNYESFTNDFSNGGWDAWFSVTQNSSNNPYGAYFEAQSDLFRQVDDAKTTQKAELDQSGGFLSFKKCKRGTEYTQADVDSSGARDWSSMTSGGIKVGDCAPSDKETATPGSVISDKLNQALGAGENRLEMSDEINEIAGAFLNQLIEKGLKGLRNLTTDSLDKDLRDNPDEPRPNPNTGNASGGGISCTTSPSVYDPITGQVSGGEQTCSSEPTSWSQPDFSGGGTSTGTTSGTGGGSTSTSTPTLTNEQTSAQFMDYVGTVRALFVRTNWRTMTALRDAGITVSYVNQVTARFDAYKATGIPGEQVTSLMNDITNGLSNMKAYIGIYNESSAGGIAEITREKLIQLYAKMYNDSHHQ